MSYTLEKTQKIVHYLTTQVLWVNEVGKHCNDYT